MALATRFELLSSIDRHDRGQSRQTLLLFRWRDAFSSTNGPPAVTRLVLWTLSKHMGMNGEDAFPSQETIAQESGLGLRAVKRHLRAAEVLGWIERMPRRRAGRASWRYGTDYVPCFRAMVPNNQYIRTLAAGTAPKSALVSEGSTISSSNSPTDLNAFKKGITSSAAQEVRERRASREAWTTAYEAEEGRQ
jgi:hypothetical protein